MRRMWIVAGCAVLAFLAVQSCEKGDSGPSAPQLSTIHVNQDKIGLGQQVVFTVEDTVAMHGSLYLIQPRWTVNGNQVLEDFTHYDFVNGRGSYMCYYTPSAVGSMDVRLEVYMIFNDAPAGEAEQTVGLRWSNAMPAPLSGETRSLSLCTVSQVWWPVEMKACISGPATALFWECHP